VGRFLAFFSFFVSLARRARCGHTLSRAAPSFFLFKKNKTTPCRSPLVPPLPGACVDAWVSEGHQRERCIGRGCPRPREWGRWPIDRALCAFSAARAPRRPRAPPLFFIARARALGSSHAHSPIHKQVRRRPRHAGAPVRRARPGRRVDGAGEEKCGAARTQARTRARRSPNPLSSPALSPPRHPLPTPFSRPHRPPPTPSSRTTSRPRRSSSRARAPRRSAWPR
jgi:hypothetical protein